MDKLRLKKKENAIHEKRMAQEHKDLSILQGMIDQIIPVDRRAVEEHYLHSYSASVRELARKVASGFVWTFQDD